MADKTCTTHNLELKLVPEGVSKAGKRYNAFYGCPDRSCKYTENIPEKKGHFLSIQSEMRRAKEIAYMNANNAAVEFVKDKQGTNVEMKESIIYWRDWFRKEWEAFYLKEVVNEED